MPRPDTETVVAAALAVVDRHGSAGGGAAHPRHRHGQRRDPARAPFRTAAGARASAPTVPRARWRRRRANARRLRRRRAGRASWSATGPSAIGGGFDLVVSNPPYIAIGGDRRACRLKSACTIPISRLTVALMGLTRTGPSSPISADCLPTRAGRFSRSAPDRQMRSRWLAADAGFAGKRTSRSRRDRTGGRTDPGNRRQTRCAHDYRGMAKDWAWKSTAKRLGSARRTETGASIAEF